MEGVDIKSSILEKRPDIATLMYQYNNYHNIIFENNPEKIGFGSNKIIHIRCCNGHELHKSAHTITHYKTDINGKFYCRECKKQQLIKVDKERINGITIKEFCKKNPKYKHIISEFDTEQNAKNGYTIDNITIGSEKPLHWICKNKHHYVTGAYNRIRRGSNCPYCSGTKLLRGFNDLASQNPEILKDWDYDKNKVKPDEVFQHSKRKVWWKCHECGYSWEATICRRTTNIQTGCPKCHTMSTSIPEMSIYITLNKIYNNVEHRKNINGYEYDIFVNDLNLAIEYDGIRFHGENGKNIETHKIQNAYDNNFHFIQIKETMNEHLHNTFNNNILYISEKNRNKIKDVCYNVLYIIQKHFDENININVDENIIWLARNEIKLKKIKNSITANSPKDAEEWHPTKNEHIKPEYVSAGSDTIKYWWKCKMCGNTYQKTPYDKLNTFKDGGCQKCMPSYKSAIICIETNKLYVSIINATRDTNINRSCISAACSGKQKTAGGYHWRYATEEEIQQHMKKLLDKNNT